MQRQQKAELRLSLHNHTTAHSDCATIEPWELVAYSAMAGLSGIAITEHGYLWKQHEILHLKRYCVEKGYCRESFMLFAGQEVYASNGDSDHHHALVFGCSRGIPANLSLHDLCRYVHMEEKGIIILAHPMKGADNIERFWEYDADGIEVMHPRQDPAKVMQELENHKPDFALLGSSDVHHIADIITYCTLFPPGVRSEEDVIAAIKKRSVKPIEI